MFLRATGGQLDFAGETAALTEPSAFQAFLAKLQDDCGPEDASNLS